MPAYAITNFFIYSIINAFTPGPGNILALNTVTNYGCRRGSRLFFGIFTGYYTVQIICALFVFGIGSFLPQAMTVVRYIGAAYILWLAVHIARSHPETGEDQGKASFLKGFLLQFVNVKIYMFGITALTGFVAPYTTGLGALMAAELVIATIGCIATTTWIGLGLLIQRIYTKYYRVINIILSLTLLECVWSILR